MKDKTTRKYLLCSSCKKRKPDVKLRVDPYIHELRDKVVEVNLCDACTTERIQDV